MDIALDNTHSSFKQKLLTGIIWRAINVLFAFIFNALFVRQLGAASSGVFFYLLNNLFFVVLFLSIGLESGISYYNARKEQSVSYFFSLSIVWSMVGAFFFFLILLLLPEQILHVKNRYEFLTLYVFGAMLNSFLSAIYFTNHNSKAPNVLAAITNIILILLLPNMPWINGSISFELYVNIYLCSVLLSPVILSFLLLKNNIHFSFSYFKTNAIKPLVLFSFHSFIIGLLFNLLKSSDYWLVKRWCSISDAGNYFQASKVMQLLLVLPALASFSLYPLIVQSIQKNENNDDQIETAERVLKLVGLYFFIALILSIAVILAGYWFFPFLYGMSFGNMYLVTLLLIPGLIFFAATYPLSTFFSGNNQNITTMIFLSIAIAVMFFCNLILTPKFFIYGAAISSSVANFIYFVLLLRKFLKQNKLTLSVEILRDFFKINTVLKSLVNIK